MAELPSILGIAPGDLARAVRTGAPVAVSTARLLARASGPLREALLDAARLAPDGMSGPDARAFDVQARTEERLALLPERGLANADMAREQTRARDAFMAAGHDAKAAGDKAELLAASASGMLRSYGLNPYASAEQAWRTDPESPRHARNVDGPFDGAADSARAGGAPAATAGLRDATGSRDAARDMERASGAARAGAGNARGEGGASLAVNPGGRQRASRRRDQERNLDDAGK